MKRRLREVVRQWSPDLIVPIDDLSSWLLRQMSASRTIHETLRGRLVTSLGPAHAVDAATRRGPLMRAAEDEGLPIPRAASVADLREAADHAASFGYPVVLKADWSCGGSGVAVARDEAALRAGFHRISRAGLVPRARAIARQATWRLAGLRTAPAFILQSFVDGSPAMHTLSCRDGHVLAGISFAAERTLGPTGSSSVVRFIENDVMAETGRRLARRLGASGFLSFDFMLPHDGGPATLIELNARPIGTTHLGARFGTDVCGSLVASIRGEPPPPPRPFFGDPRIALFPKEQAPEPGLALDRPAGDPGLMAAYRARSERRFSRMLHDRERAGALPLHPAGGAGPRTRHS